MIRLLEELLYPRKCVLCRRFLGKDETDLCRRCRVDAPEYRYGRKKLPRIKDMTAVWFYDDKVRSSILRYKFGRGRHYAGAYGRLLAMRIRRDLPEPELITWVPISAKRLRQRGFDQVQLLAEAVAEELQVESVMTIEKFRENKANSSLATPEERRANVLGVYRPISPERFRGKRVLLLDDVVTTGATASECARVLLTAGAAEVLFAAVAAAGNTQNK